MNKSELVNAVAQSADLPKAAAARAIDAMTATITGSLRAGNSVALVGFGSFNVKNRAARTGRNPQTGEVIKIKASKSVGFRPAKALKERL